MTEHNIIGKRIAGRNREERDFHTLSLELWKDPGGSEKPRKNDAGGQKMSSE